MTTKREVSVLIPYYKENDKVFVFMQKRSKDAKRIPDYFGFFGGGLENGENPEDGLKREIKEELNIELTNMHKFFNKYEFYGSIVNVFSLEVDKDFKNKTEILEGQYGKFMSEEDIDGEDKIIPQDRLILGNFLGLLERDNPYL